MMTISNWVFEKKQPIRKLHVSILVAVIFMDAAAITMIIKKNFSDIYQLE